MGGGRSHCRQLSRPQQPRVREIPSDQPDSNGGRAAPPEPQAPSGPTVWPSASHVSKSHPSPTYRYVTDASAPTSPSPFLLVGPALHRPRGGPPREATNAQTTLPLHCWQCIAVIQLVPVGGLEELAIHCDHDVCWGPRSAGPQREKGESRGIEERAREYTDRANRQGSGDEGLSFHVVRVKAAYSSQG